MYGGPTLTSSKHDPLCIVSRIHIFVPLSSTLSLHSTLTGLDLSVGDGHRTGLDASIVGQLVESLKPNVEPAGGGIDGKNVDSLVSIARLVTQCIAAATARRIPSSN